MKKWTRAISFMLALTFTFASCTAATEGGAYKAGTYVGSGTGKNGTVKVQVIFDETKITDIEIMDNSETTEFAKSVFETIPELIISQQNLNVDTLAGATMTSKAVLEAVGDCVVQAGGDLEKMQETAKTSTTEKTEDITTDIVVIGAGASGTAAALSAIEISGNKVVLLEKTASPMGAGTLAGGLFAADSSQQKAEGKTVDKEWLFDQYMTSSDGYMNSLLVRRIIEESGTTVDWLEENGCDLNLAEAGSGGSFEHQGMPATVHGYVEGGTVAITKLVESFTEKGGEVYFSTPATELIYDAEQNIIGVKAKKPDGTFLNVYAKAVIIGSGGFGGNVEMLEKYVGVNSTMGEIASCTGDGINMAWGAGADEYGVGTLQYFWESIDGESIGPLYDAVGDDYFGLTSFSRFPNLRVNLNGQRFSNETLASLYSVHGAQIHMQPAETELVIIDSQMLSKIKEGGLISIEDHYGVWENNPQVFMEFNEPNDTDMFLAGDRKPVDYTPLLEGSIGTNVVFKGDTIEELAEAMGVDVENFKASVMQYNTAITTGEDGQFFADTTRLIPVTEGPFYAIKFVARNLGTLGGVRINENMEALDAEGKVIPGLYVVGADAGGMYGKSYVDFEGGTLGFAYISGKIAGDESSEYIASLEK